MRVARVWGVVGALEALLLGEQGLELVDCGLDPAGIRVADGQVVAGGQGVGVVGAEEVQLVGEEVLEQVDGGVDLPGCTGPVGEVVAGVQGVGVVRAEDS